MNEIAHGKIVGISIHRESVVIRPDNRELSSGRVLEVGWELFRLPEIDITGPVMNKNCCADDTYSLKKGMKVVFCYKRKPNGFLQVYGFCSDTKWKDIERLVPVAIHASD